MSRGNHTATSLDLQHLITVRHSKVCGTLTALPYGISFGDISAACPKPALRETPIGKDPFPPIGHRMAWSVPTFAEMASRTLTPEWVRRLIGERDAANFPGAQEPRGRLCVRLVTTASSMAHGILVWSVCVIEQSAVYSGYEPDGGRHPHACYRRGSPPAPVEGLFPGETGGPDPSGIAAQLRGHEPKMAAGYGLGVSLHHREQCIGIARQRQAQPAAQDDHFRVAQTD
jgi:hypothetical protein